MKKWTIIMGFAAIFFASCASTEQKNLEEARFLLDQGKFDEAIALVQPIVEAEPNNNEAKFILASALVGNFALSPKAGCQSTDTGYLGALACILDEKDDSDENGLQTLGRIAPTSDEQNQEIDEAVELLESITTFSDQTPEVDVALQRMIARTFAISTIFNTIGITSENEDCNAGGAGVDEVPDDFDPDNITLAEAEQFVDNLEGIEEDSRIAGLDLDFNLFTTAQEVLDDIEGTGFDARDAVIEIFNESYNTAEQQICD